MAVLRSIYKALWTPIDFISGRRWMLVSGWLVFVLGIVSTNNHALSINLFKLAGWFIIPGTLEQRFEARLWPFNRPFVRAKRLLATAKRIALIRVDGLFWFLGVLAVFALVIRVFVGLIIRQ